MFPEFVTLDMSNEETYCSIHKRDIPPGNWRHFEHIVEVSLRLKQGPPEECVCNCHSQELFRQDEELRYQRIIEARDAEWKAYQEARSRPQKKSPGESEGPGRWYTATFTRPDTERTPDGVLKSTTRMLKSKQICALQWCYSLELTQAGTPHTHIYFFSNKYFDYKKAGAFNDGNRFQIEPARFGQSYADYLAKSETKPTKAWLSSNGLEGWFWCSPNYSGPRPDENKTESLCIQECPAVVLPAVRSLLAANV